MGAYQLAITIGLLLAAVVDNATKDLDNTGSYRIPIAVRKLPPHTQLSIRIGFNN